MLQELDDPNGFSLASTVDLSAKTNISWKYYNGTRTVLYLSAAWGGIEKRNPMFDKLSDYGISTSRKLEIQPHATG